MAASAPLVSIRVGPLWREKSQRESKSGAIMTYRADISVL